MSSIVEISANVFNQTIAETEKPVIVEFWIRACSGCQKFKTIYEQLSKIFGDQVTFLKMSTVKTMENLKFAESFNIVETPTTKIFYRGEEIGEIVGYRTLDAVISEIETILERRGTN